MNDDDREDTRNRLSLHHRGLDDSRLAERLRTSPRVHVLDASYNHLRLAGREIQDILWDACRDCTRIMLSNNILFELSSPKRPLYHLTVLDMSFNAIAALDEDLFLAMPNLQRVRLASNCLTRLPVSITTLGALENLDLSGNRLTELSRDMDALGRLKTLDVQQNLLVEFPRWLAKLPMLERIDLSSNRISSIPELDLGQSKRLTEMRLRRNVIRRFDESSLTWPPQLRILDLWDNKIQVFPRRLFDSIPPECTILLAGNPCVEDSDMSCVQTVQFTSRGSRLIEMAARQKMAVAATIQRSLTPPICRYLDIVPRPCANCPMRYLQPCAKVCFRSRVGGHSDVPVEDYVCSLGCMSKLCRQTGDEIKLSEDDLLDRFWPPGRNQ